MSLATLLIRPMTVIRRTSGDTFDEYGGDIPDESAVDVLGEIQQTRRDEPADASELSVTTWTVFLPIGTLVRTGDAILYAGESFEVVGEPWQANTGSATMHHVECTVKRTSTPSDEEGS